ncbi:hypothetical protein [Amycolatopsis sp. cmx-4-61]|uniref:hypothetical protein n=1 Tax=Amycolatopsis sp. cmx-4-61 TaxID=2790937 RepID=UPI00397937E8
MIHRNALVPPGVAFSPRLICISGDRLIHPSDNLGDEARIVVRLARGWLPETWRAHRHFTDRGAAGREKRCYSDDDVTGWLLLDPRPGSLAWQVRMGKLDITTALTAEAEIWPW